MVAHSGHALIKERSRQIKKDRAYLKSPRQTKKLCSKLLPQNRIKKKKVKNIL